MAEATIILPNFNNEQVLPILFRSLKTFLNCPRYDFIMVDDGSEDDSVAMAKREVQHCGFASVEIIQLPHRGIVHALNTALSSAKTEFVIRLDGDATVETPDWISKLIMVLRHEEIGIVGGSVIFEDGRVHSFGRSVLGETGLHDVGCVPLEPTGSRTFDSIVYRPQGRFSDGCPYEVDTILGVCVAFRRSEAQAAGGFDTRFNPVWIEDDDFGLGIRRLGRRVVVYPKIHVIHRPGLRGSREPGLPTGGKAGRTFKDARFYKIQKDIFNRIIRRGKMICGKSRSAYSIEDCIPVESSPWRSSILKSHYENWRQKWGFDPMNPDLLKIYQKYWDTSLCWRVNPSQLESSRAFIRKMAAENL